MDLSCPSMYRWPSPAQGLARPSGSLSVHPSLTSATQQSWAMWWVAGLQLTWLCHPHLIPPFSLNSQEHRLIYENFLRKEKQVLDKYWDKAVVKTKAS